MHLVNKFSSRDERLLLAAFERTLLVFGLLLGIRLVVDRIRVCLVVEEL